MTKINECDIVRDLIPLYVDHVASETSERLVINHVEACPECRKFLEETSGILAIPVSTEDRMEERKAFEKFKRAINKEIICGLGTLSAIVFFIVTCVFQIKNGYARDAGVYVSPIISSSLWILLGVCIVFIIAFRKIDKMPVKKSTEKAALILLIVLIVSGLGVNIGWAVSFDKAKVWDIQHENIHPITLSELETAIQESDFQVIYIGGDNCPLCVHIAPDFISYLESEGLDVLYYNIKQDRKNNKENMDRVLDSVPVSGIPFIMIIDNQEISATFMGEHIVDELREYMSTHCSD